MAPIHNMLFRVIYELDRYNIMFNLKLYVLRDYVRTVRNHNGKWARSFRNERGSIRGLTRLFVVLAHVVRRSSVLRTGVVRLMR